MLKTHNRRTPTVTGRRRHSLAAAALVAGLACTGVSQAGTAQAVPAPTTAEELPPVNCPAELCKTIISHEKTPGLQNPAGVAVDGSHTAYVVDNIGQKLYRVNLATLEKEVITDVTTHPVGVALDGRGTAYVASYHELWAVDLATKKSTKVAALPGARFWDVEVKGDYAYLTGQVGKRLYRVPLTGADKGSVEVVTQPQPLASTYGLAWESEDNVFVGVTGQLHQVNPQRGTWKPVVEGTFFGLAFSPSRQLYGVDTKGTLYRIDPAAGKKTAVATGFTGAWDITFDTDGNAYVADFNGRAVVRVSGVESPAPPPPPGDGKRPAVEMVHGVTAHAGRNAVPKVNVTNNTTDRIGKRTVTLTLGPGLTFAYGGELYLDRGGVQTYRCHPNSTGRAATCPDVELDLYPGSTMELRTEVKTNSDLRAGEIPHVSFNVDGVGQAKADFKIVPEG
ncbi:hypothetical protein [Streptomyces flavidovirens]